MGMPTDISILDVVVSFTYKTFRAKLKFGGAVKGPSARSAADLNVSVLAETRRGSRARGHGSMVLGSSWSWPSQSVPSVLVTDCMRGLAIRFGGELRRRAGCAHPMEHALEAESTLLELAEEMVRQYELPASMPKLCALVVGAPFDAALHDAFGKANGIDAYDGLGPEHLDWDLSRYLGPAFTGRYPADHVRPAYVPALPVFHLVGAADPKKNLNRFIDGYILNYQRRSGDVPHRVLVGNEDWGGFDSIREAIDLGGIRSSVHFTGYVDRLDLPGLYRGASLFVFPSLYEGFGLPLVEAMASGAACLVSDIPVFHELGGDCVEYFDPNSHEDMAVKLDQVLHDSERLTNMRECSSERGRSFTWEETARRTIQVYKTLLSEDLS